MVSSALSAGTVLSPANEGAAGTQQAPGHAPGACQSFPVGTAIARASQVITQAQVLCDRAESQIAEGGHPADLEGFVYALNLQIGMVGHLLDCAMRAAGDIPVRSSLGEWLGIGDIEAALPDLRAGVSQ